MTTTTIQKIVEDTEQETQKVAAMPSSVRERKVSLPEANAKAMVADFASNVAVIVTHPWGPLGGNMNNNVVLAIVVWFQQLKITTMRFDFSGYQIGRGDRQVAQVKEAADFLLEGRHLDSPSQVQSASKSTPQPPKYILLVGYSYGSIISASASIQIPQCIGVAMLSPPLAVRHWLYLFHGNYHLEQARKSGRPLLMIIGSHDNFTAESAFMDVVESMPTSTTTGAVLKDADHFFRGREQDLMDVMGKFNIMLRYREGAVSSSLSIADAVRLARPPFLGHWLLNVFPQCNGDLKMLCKADFSSFIPTAITTSASGDSFMACAACITGD